METRQETPLTASSDIQTGAFYGTNEITNGGLEGSARYSSRENLVQLEQSLFQRLQARFTKLTNIDTENENFRRTLSTISGVCAPVALSMFGTLLFQRIGKFNKHWGWGTLLIRCIINKYKQLR